MLEPRTSKLFLGNGRTGGDRTRDPNIKSVVLYQLSYSPLGVENVGYYNKIWLRTQGGNLRYGPILGARVVLNEFSERVLNERTLGGARMRDCQFRRGALFVTEGDYVYIDCPWAVFHRADAA